jgi:tripartite-type tricarboxylate transporter receptor subunit TctC
MPLNHPFADAPAPSNRRTLLASLMGVALASTFHPSWAQSPAPAANAPAGRVIRLVVPYPPGGPLDIAARALAEAVKGTLGTVVVDNRPGAGGNVGADFVAKAVPDGTTLLVGAVATHAINPSLYPRMPFDAVRDFAPLTLIAEVPNVLILNDAFARENGIASVSDLIAWLKRHPGRSQFASGGNGSAGHLAGELFKMRTQTFALHIPYRGAAPAMMALLSGEVQFMFDNLASAAPRIREGKVRALAVTTLQAPNMDVAVPTLDASGVAALKGFDINTWFALFAPAGVPKATLDGLHKAFVEGLQSAGMASVLGRMLAKPQPSSPEALAQRVAADAAKYREIVRYSGAKAD